MIKFIFLFLILVKSIFAFSSKDFSQYSINFGGSVAAGGLNGCFDDNTSTYCVVYASPIIDISFAEPSDISNFKILNFSTSWSFSVKINDEVVISNSTGFTSRSFDNVYKISIIGNSSHLFIRDIYFNFEIPPPPPPGSEYTGINTDLGETNYIRSEDLSENQIIDNMLVFTSFKQMEDYVPAVGNSYGGLFGFASLLVAGCADYSRSNYKKCELYYKPAPVNNRTSCDNNPAPYHFTFIETSIDGGNYCALNVLLPIADLQFLTNNIVKVNDLLLNANLVNHLTYTNLSTGINQVGDNLTNLANAVNNLEFSGGGNVNVDLSTLTATVNNINGNINTLTSIVNIGFSNTATTLGNIDTKIDNLTLLSNSTNTAVAQLQNQILQNQTAFNNNQVVLNQTSNYIKSRVDENYNMLDNIEDKQFENYLALKEDIQNLENESSSSTSILGSLFNFFTDDDDDGDINNSVGGNVTNLANTLSVGNFETKELVCPTFAIPMDYFNLKDYEMTSHCDMLAAAQVPIQAIMLMFFTILGFRISFSA